MDALPPHVTKIEHCIEAPSGVVSSNAHTIIVSGPSSNIARFSDWLRRYPSWKLTELNRESGTVVVAFRAPNETPWREVAATIFNAQKAGLQTGYVCKTSSNESN